MGGDDSTPSTVLPAEWQSHIRDLSSKIAKLVPPSSNIALLASNISSLAPEDIAAVESALKTQLASAGVHFATVGAADTPVRITLSEGVDGYVAVAQVDSNGNDQVAIVMLPPIPGNAAQADGVLLDAKLVWQQSTQILDFALPAMPGFSQNTLAVLEPQRLAFYSRDLTPQWQFVREIASPSSIATRDWRGRIELSQTSGDARWPGSECKGDFLRPASVTCSASNHRDEAWISSELRTPLMPANGGDAVSIALQCRSHPIALATGGGDWTQSDFIQAYEMRSLNREGVVPSGGAVNFDGPVMAIWPASAPAVARAVIRNLQTGNYEAYVVTATCSQ